MIDHIGFPVSDYARAKAFYTKALAPLGYSLIMEVTQEQTGHDPAAGFGANGKPDFWIGGEGGLNKPLHVAIVAKDRATVAAFYQTAMAAGRRETAGRGAGRECRSRANRGGRKNCQEARQMNRRCGDRVDRVRLRLQPTPGSAICPVKGQIWIRVPADMPQGTM